MEAEKMIRDGKVSQANELLEKCKELHMQWRVAQKKFTETIKVY